MIGAHVVHRRAAPGSAANNRIFQFASIGGAPQDKKYAGEPTRLEIGDRNTIREFVHASIAAPAQDGGVTRIGDDNWIMAYVHIAHDCQIGNHTIFANNAQLAGHVAGRRLTRSSAASRGVHQFCRIGAHGITGMGTIVLQDVPPYVTASGNPARPYGINSEGLRRRGFGPERDRRAQARLQNALSRRH